ncbi:hypothetical protein PDESU_04259 [Pontiella desulfatans]|uniref:Uncharacterized protein n=1 Tax=Pontiella desulfatans TaxID=2750659 RepID=A0A6C2U8D0_PONDE|nr:hypothetical protein [Pontiella desulfatans]VGO15674.1 hypothetical protein PDESU_04259 [Pontiella desulfatans]
MSKNKLLLFIALIIIGMGTLVVVNHTAVTVADIHHGDWARITHSDGTLSYAPWKAHMSDGAAVASMEKDGFTLEQVTGYGVRISKRSGLHKKAGKGRIHLFDTLETAIRFAKENSIPDQRILRSGDGGEPTGNAGRPE